MTANLKQRMEDNWIYFASHVIDHVNFTKNQEYHRNNEFTKSDDIQYINFCGLGKYYKIVEFS